MKSRINWQSDRDRKCVELLTGLFRDAAIAVPCDAEHSRSATSLGCALPNAPTRGQSRHARMGAGTSLRENRSATQPRFSLRDTTSPQRTQRLHGRMTNVFGRGRCHSPSFLNRWFTCLKWKSREQSFSSSPGLKCLAAPGSAFRTARKSASSRPACLILQVFIAASCTR